VEHLRVTDLDDSSITTRPTIVKFRCAVTKYTIADIANYAWYGSLVLTNLYETQEFLDVASYTTLFAGRPKSMRDRRFSVVGGSTARRSPL